MSDCAINGFERATDKYFAIRLHSNRSDPEGIAYSCARIKAEVQAPIGVEAGNAITVRAVDGAELAADDNLAIRLQSDRVNLSVRPCSRIETAVQASIRVEPGNSGPIRADDRVEIPAHEHLAIRLQGERTNNPVRSSGGSETAV